MIKQRKEIRRKTCPKAKGLKRRDRGTEEVRCRNKIEHWYIVVELYWWVQFPAQLLQTTQTSKKWNFFPRFSCDFQVRNDTLSALEIKQKLGNFKFECSFTVFRGWGKTNLIYGRNTSSGQRITSYICWWNEMLEISFHTTVLECFKRRPDFIGSKVTSG